MSDTSLPSSVLSDTIQLFVFAAHGRTCVKTAWRQESTDGQQRQGDAHDGGIRANGEAALEAVAQRPPDVVLADVMMPRMDGFELLRALRSNPHTQTLPVILLSDRAGEESRVEGLEAGADDYLIKPFSARELVARVSAQHGRKRLQVMQKQAEAVHA